MKVSDWPTWLQWLVIVPHGLLGFLMFWLWWPKEGSRGRRWYAIIAAYLLVFYLVMRFVVGF